MNIIKLVGLTIVIWCAMPLQSAPAGTIPAGTVIIVKTSTAIHSKDGAGRKFKAELARGIGVSGKVVMPAGTPVGGVVKSPWMSIGSTTRPLTLRLAELVSHGRAVAIKTDDFEAENSSPWSTRRGVQVTSGNFTLPAGTILQFRLTQPVDI